MQENLSALPDFLCVLPGNGRPMPEIFLHPNARSGAFGEQRGRITTEWIRPRNFYG